MRILVTGGNGYVGRTLCKLLSPKYQVCVLDNLRYGTNRFCECDLKSLEWANVDIRERSEVRSTIAEYQPDVIIHLAAVHFIPECEADPELAICTNVLGTANLAEACPPNCRFVFASSGAVYQPELTPHHELTSVVEPADIYGWSKLQGEQYVRYYARRNGFTACVVRLFNVIGPGETNLHVLPEIIAQLKAGRATLRLGNLDAHRDYIHVNDVASGFAAVATSGEIEKGETAIVNLGTQCSYSVKQLLEYLRLISHLDFSVESDTSRMRASDRPFLTADISKIGKRFRWQPTYDIQASLTDLWHNPDLPQAWIDRYR